MRSSSTCSSTSAIWSTFTFLQLLHHISSLQSVYSHFVFLICASLTSSLLHGSLPKFFLQAHGFLSQGDILNWPFSAPQEVCEATSAVSQPSHLSSYRWRDWRVTLQLRLISGPVKIVTDSHINNLLWTIDRAAVWSSSGRRRVFRLVTPGCFLCASPFRKSIWGCGCAAALIPCGWKIKTNISLQPL